MPKSILIVEDDAVLRAMLKDVLAPDGYTLSEAVDGDAALTALASALPDLMLLDLWLPQRSGLDVLRQVKERWPSLKVLVVSSTDSDRLVDQAIADGAAGFISKPFQAMQVRMAVKLELEGKA